MSRACSGTQWSDMAYWHFLGSLGNMYSHFFSELSYLIHIFIKCNHILTLPILAFTFKPCQRGTRLLDHPAHSIMEVVITIIVIIV